MGRHRTFDVEEALAAATKLFWRGYDQTSLTDLTKTLGIAPASFYFAFESKEALFRQVVGRYVAMRDEAFERAFLASTISAGVEALLRSYVDALTDPAHVPGCLLVNNSLSTANEDALNQWLVKHRTTFRTMLEKRFLEGLMNGRLPEDFDSKAMSRFVVTIAGGLAVEAKSGAGRKELHTMIDIAMESIIRRTRDQPQA